MKQEKEKKESTIINSHFWIIDIANGQTKEKKSESDGSQHEISTRSRNPKTQSVMQKIDSHPPITVHLIHKRESKLESSTTKIRN